MADRISFEECVHRVKQINNKLQDQGCDWQQIENFWKAVFQFCNALDELKEGINSVEIEPINPKNYDDKIHHNR